MKRVAILCLVFSLLSFGQECVSDYNRNVRVEQIDREVWASHSMTFSHDWGWGIDYPARDRNLTVALCICAFFVAVAMRRGMVSLLLSLGLYVLTIPLIYQWITVSMRDVSMNTLYMADSPYLLRIASTFDWLLFAGLALAMIVNIDMLIRTRGRTQN
jgi:hypothetical protein